MAYLNIFLVSVIYLSAGADGQRFLVEPRNTAARLGGSAELTCVVDAAERVVEWSYKDEKIYDSTTKTVTDPSKYAVTVNAETNYRLRILNVQPEIVGNYTCRMPDEDVEAKAYLIGLGEPSCSDDMEVNEPDRFDLDCNATFYSGDGRFPPNPQWYRGEKAIGAFSHTSFYDTEVRYSISEKAEGPEANQHYTCRLEYRSSLIRPDPPVYPGDISCSTSVTVYFGPRDMEILPEPARIGQNVKAMVGDHVNCTAAGNPEPVITWLDEDGKEVSSTYQLLVTKEMNGFKKYTCLAENTVAGMAYNLTMDIGVTSEAKPEPNGSDHNAPLASFLLLTWIGFWHSL